MLGTHIFYVCIVGGNGDKKCLSLGIRASHFSPKTLIKLETTEKIWGNFRSR